MAKQRNISMDVQVGVGELEELIDVIENYRNNWKFAEKEKQVSMQALEEAKKRLEMEVRSASSITPSKRCATSPTEGNSERITKKRIPASPLEKPFAKKQVVGEKIERRVDQPVAEEENVGKNKERKKRKKSKRKKTSKSKAKSEAVLIKPATGRTHAEVLADVRMNVRPEDAKVAVRSISKTKSGSMLLVMGNGGEKEKFC